MSVAITIPKRITHGDELIILQKDEYNRLIKHNEEIAHALRVIAEGEKAYKEGRTIKASSLKEALKIHAKRQN